MTKIYKPQNGSVAQRAIAYFDANPDAQLSSEQLAVVLGSPRVSITTSMRPVCAAGLICSERVGFKYVWSKPQTAAQDDGGACSEAAQDAAAEPVFIVGIYSDGDISITGARAIEDGIMLDRAQAARLVKVVMHTHGYFEALGLETLPACAAPAPSQSQQE